VHVKAEFVVPIFKDGKIAGELDIDSHTSWPFSDEDRVFLGQICAGVGPRL
jgi:GAF domain-containing protein